MLHIDKRESRKLCARKRSQVQGPTNIVGKSRQGSDVGSCCKVGLSDDKDVFQLEHSPRTNYLFRWKSVITVKTLAH